MPGKRQSNSFVLTAKPKDGNNGLDAVTALFSPGVLFVDADSSGVSIGAQTFIVNPSVVHNGTRLGPEYGLYFLSKPSGVTATENDNGKIVVTVPSGTAESGYEGEVIVSMDARDGENFYTAVGAIEVVAKRRGQLGKMCYIAGEYSDDIEYTSNDTQTVAVEVPVSGTDQTELYYLDASTNWVRNGSVVQTKYKPKDGSGVWVKALNDYNLVRTRYLFADFANLGASVISGNWQFSQIGIMNVKLVTSAVNSVSFYINITAGLRLQQGKSYTFTIRGSVDTGFLSVRLYNPTTGYSTSTYFNPFAKERTVTVSSVATSSSFYIQACISQSGATAKVDSITVESSALYLHFDPLFPLAREREIFPGSQSVGNTQMTITSFEMTEGMSYKIKINGLLSNTASGDSDPYINISVVRSDDSSVLASGYIQEGDTDIGFFLNAVTAGTHRVVAKTEYSGTTGTIGSITLEPLNAFVPNYAVDLMTGNLIGAGGAFRADDDGVHVIGTMELSNGLTAGDAVAKYGKMELNGDAYGPFISMSSYTDSGTVFDGYMRIGIDAAGTAYMRFASVTNASYNYVRYSKEGFDSKLQVGNTVHRTQVGHCDDGSANGSYGIYVSTDTSNYVRVTADGISFPGQMSLTKSGFHIRDTNGGIDFNMGNTNHKYCKFATVDQNGDPAWLLFYGGICVGVSTTDPGSNYKVLPGWDENT